MRLALAGTVFAVMLATTTVAAAADTSRRPLPDTLPDGATRVTVLLPLGSVPTWQLGWSLSNPAEGAATFVRRPLWSALAAAIESVPVPTDATLAEVRLVDGAEVLIATAADPAGRLVTLVLPKGVLRPHSGKRTFGLDTDFSRVRTTTQDLTTWPVEISLAGWHEPKADRRLEGSIALGRDLVEERSRPAARDENGEPISFRDQPTRTLRDAQHVRLNGAWLATVARSEAWRSELGATLEATWQQDEADLVDSRTVSLIGGEWRASSLAFDDQSFRLAVAVGGTRSRYLVVDPIVDPATGEVIGQERTVESHNLPIWQVALGGQAPLLRAANLTVILFEGNLSWQQAFEGSGGDEQRPDRLESVGILDLGLKVRTPIGAELGFGIAVEHRELPGEAGERIDDLTWATRARTSLRIGF